MVRSFVIAASLPLLSVSLAGLLARQDAVASFTTIDSASLIVQPAATGTGTSDPDDNTENDGDDVWDESNASNSLPVPTGFVSVDLSQPVTVTLVDIK